MRRRPEAPRPCSCSGRIGDLEDTSAFHSQERALTHLAMRSSWPASRLMRLVDMDSGATCPCASRLPVLLFFGSET